MFLLLLSVLIPTVCSILQVQRNERRFYDQLDGLWTFVREKRNSPSVGINNKWHLFDLSQFENATVMPVPAAYNDLTADREVREHVGWVWYQRSFFVSVRDKSYRHFVRFSSVQYYAVVFINDKIVGIHVGGHLPFEIDITSHVSFDNENRLTVAVNNTMTSRTIPPGEFRYIQKKYGESKQYPDGFFKQTWNFDFFNYAGILRPVYITRKPFTYIDDISIDARANGFFGYKVNVISNTQFGRIQVTVLDKYGTVIFESNRYHYTGQISNIRPWWPRDMGAPVLYNFVVRLTISNILIDVYRLRFGFRTVSISEDQTFINGKPFYCHGFGMHEDFELHGRGYNPVVMTKDLNMLEWMSGNCYRTSHYPYSEEMAFEADRRGIAVITETPAVGLSYFTKQNKLLHAEIIRELIERDRNHPSTIMWSLANEPISSDLAARSYFSELINLTRTTDPTRPVTAVLATSFESDQIGDLLDIICINRYFGWYIDTGYLETINHSWVFEVNNWKLTYNKPIIVSEYGAEALPGLNQDPSHAFSEQYQQELLKQTHYAFDILRKTHAITGEMIWNLADFMTADVKQEMANNSILEDLPEAKQLYRHEIAFPAYRGADLLRVPRYNKGMAFSLSERQHLGIHGLLPAAFETEELQVYRVICQLREENDNLKKYIILDNLQDQNEKLYYRVVIEHVHELLPIIYTPTVGLACQKFGHIFRRPKGIYITINDNSISKIYQILSNWPEHDVRAIVVTDGERILGLGDLGAYGMGIPIGKLSLYVAFGGVQPKWCLPIVLDCGTDSEELLKDPFYIGLRQKRVRGAQYDLLIDNFMKACVKRFGQKTLIQFEDFANTNAGRLLAKYRNEYATFNDDIQGTASIVVAGLLSCGNILQRKMSEQILLFLGAGAAATGTADMCVLQMQREGTSEKDACKRIFLINSKGLITVNSPVVKSEHQKYAKEMTHMKDLLEIIEKVRPTGIIGVSTVHGAFSEQIIRKMVEINERPIIFALSNPTSKSECTAEEAIQYTKGKALFASGSPFPDVNYDGKCYKPGQGNNSYIFPGIGLGVVLFEVRHIDEEIFLIAAREVASSVTEEDISFGCIYPSLCKIREISVSIALEIGKYSYKHGIAGLYPQPENMEQYIRSQIYSVNYDELIYKQYNWPVEDTIKSIPVLPAKENNS